MAQHIKIKRAVIAGGKVHAADTVLEVGKEIGRNLAGVLVAGEHAEENTPERAPQQQPPPARQQQQQQQQQPKDPPAQ